MLIKTIIKPEQKIADLGSGTGGEYWKQYCSPNCTIDAYDLYIQTESKNTNINFIQKGVTTLYKEKSLKNKYDLVVAFHIFEHVNDPESLAASISHILKPGCYLDVGIPDATNFTDRFYRLIHHDGGGHISQFSKGSFESLMTQFNFSLEKSRTWGDDFSWLEKLYSLKNNKVEYLTQEELIYIAKVLRKEITLEKGYFYGWELVFKKINDSR